MALLSKPLFPNVPKLPGVPQLRRSSLFPPSALPVLQSVQAVGALFSSLIATPRWGVFDELGDRVLEPDNIMEFLERAGGLVTSAPVQRGSFANYNFVMQSTEYGLRMTKGGTEAERKTFLEVLDRITKSIALFTVRTPERSYSNVKLERYDSTRREARGASFLDVDLYLKEIREVEPQFTSTAADTRNALNPSAQPPTNVGKVQPTDVKAEAQAVLLRLREFNARTGNTIAGNG